MPPIVTGFVKFEATIAATVAVTMRGGYMKSAFFAPKFNLHLMNSDIALERNLGKKFRLRQKQ